MREVEVIPVQFRQLLYNLISNSLKFSNGNRIPHIKIQHNIVFGSKSDFEKLVKGKTYYHLSVSDNGNGFDDQYRNKIFEVFQRLHGKEEYMGTGIWLAIVNKIVENRNGLIRAIGVPGQGATFELYFEIQP